MAKEGEWKQMDDYYWQGPDGWTICKVFLPGRIEVYEICKPGAPVFLDSRPTLAEAIKRYAELVHIN